LLHGLFSGCRERGLLSRCGVWASHCGDCSRCGAKALGHVGFTSCGTWAQCLQLLGSGAQAQQWWYTLLVAPRHVGSCCSRDRTVSPALAGRFFTTGPPGKPSFLFFNFFFFWLHHTVFGILVPQPGIEPRPLAVEAWNPNLWATRESPHPFKVYNSMLFSIFTDRCNYDPSEF